MNISIKKYETIKYKRNSLLIVKCKIEKGIKKEMIWFMLQDWIKENFTLYNVIENQLRYLSSTEIECNFIFNPNQDWLEDHGYSICKNSYCDEVNHVCNECSAIR